MPDNLAEKRICIERQTQSDRHFHRDCRLLFENRRMGRNLLEAGGMIALGTVVNSGLATL